MPTLCSGIGLLVDYLGTVKRHAAAGLRHLSAEQSESHQRGSAYLLRLDIKSPYCQPMLYIVKPLFRSVLWFFQ